MLPLVILPWRFRNKTHNRESSHSLAASGLPHYSQCAFILYLKADSPHSLCGAALQLKGYMQIGTIQTGRQSFSPGKKIS